MTSLLGDFGIDSMAGGTGNDRYVVENAADQVIEAAGQGIDLVAAIGDFTYSLALDVENLELCSTPTAREMPSGTASTAAAASAATTPCPGSAATTR